MSMVNYKWQWRSSTCWNDYDIDVSRVIESKYGLEHFPLIKIHDVMYQIDFDNLKQINTIKGRKRDIRRISLKNNCYNPHKQTHKYNHKASKQQYNNQHVKPNTQKHGYYKWQWSNDRGDIWKNYDVSTSKYIESRFSQNITAFQCKINNKRYYINIKNIKNMTQANTATGKVRKIRRHFINNNKQIFNCNNGCKLETCISIKRLQHALSNLSSHTTVYQSKYDDITLLNDFNHLLSVYNNCKEFEHIYNYLNKTIYSNQRCNMFRCIMSKRNYRDRLNQTKLYTLYGNNDIHNIVTLQILDRIHCHFLHSFDMLYKLPNHMKVNAKRFQSNKCILGNRMNKYNKYVTQINKHNYTQQTLSQYQFGYRFYYWPYYKDNLNKYDKAALFAITETQAFNTHCGQTVGEWFIDPYFDTMKDELLRHINIFKYNILMQKVITYIATNAVKSLKCARDESAQYYEMKYDDPIQTEHVMALLIYCNFDKLQYDFSQSFRKKHPNESIASLKTRHSKLYWLARRLRECVECIGKDVSKNNINFESNLTLYHGISENLTFQSVSNAYIMCPFSTSKDRNVGINFSGSIGILLELQINIPECMIKFSESVKAMKRITCFDCEMFSDFSNEAEVLFIGGINPIKITNIIECLTGNDYSIYISGLRMLTRNMTTAGLSLSPDAFNVDKVIIPSKLDVKKYKKYVFERDMAFRLLSHEVWTYFPNYPKAYEWKNCPEYFKKILHSECVNIKGIGFLNDGLIDNKAQDLFFRNENNWIKLDILMTVFPNVDFIAYTAINKDWRNIHTILEYILNFIENSWALPGEISMFISVKFETNVNSYIKEYENKFEEHSYEIEMRVMKNDRTVNDELKKLGFDREKLKKHHALFSGQIDEFMDIANIDIKYVLRLNVRRKLDYLK